MACVHGLRAALMLSLSLAGCSHLTTNVGAPLPPRQSLDLAVGTSTVGDVLHALGPPARLTATPEGFAMLYEHNFVTENQIGFYIPYGLLSYLKFVNAKARLDHDCWAMTFDSDGRLTGWGEEGSDRPFGSGFAMQIIVAEKALVDTSKVSQPATQHTWGEACLVRLPKAANVAQSLSDGSYGFEQTLSPLGAGQHALEMANPAAWHFHSPWW